jgi:hypothetical protein
MTLPLAHIGHYLWILYLLPVLFVVIGIAKTTLSEKRRDPDDPDPLPDPSRRGDASPGGDTGEGPRTDPLDRPQDPPP